ncbi:TraB/GumN family protein [Candidatus Riflebacteria bacterium]
MAKQIIILFMFVVVFFACCGSTRREPIYRYNKRNGLVYIENEQTPFTGIAFTEYSNGKLNAEQSYKNGELNGIRKQWYENEQLKLEGDYKDGKAEGIWKFWYDNGKLETEQSFKNGELNGILKAWYKNGQLKQEGDYKDGKTQGIWKFWYDNGKLKAEKSYINGVLNGIVKQWYENGQLKLQCDYKDGKGQGIARVWYENGKLKNEENCRDGELHRAIKTWYPNGKLERKATFKDGKVDGTALTWHENGKPHLVYNYRAGNEHGECKSWFNNGLLEFDGNFINGKPHGINKSWDKKGNLKKEETFTDGKLIKRRRWDKNGKETVISCTSNNYLWKVETEEACVYLLGSFHFFKKEMYPLDENIEDAFLNSDFLVLELELNNETQKKLHKRIQEEAKYKGNETLSQNISPELNERLRKYLKKNGKPVNLFEKFVPMYVSTFISSVELQRLGITPEAGIDFYFYNRASATRTIISLETIDEQIPIILGTHFSKATNESFLKDTLEHIEDIPAQMDDGILAWSHGDALALDNLLLESLRKKETADFFEKAYVERNLKMLIKIEKFLKGKGNYFVIVGAAHLAGKKGLIELLQKKNYKISQVKHARAG